MPEEFRSGYVSLVGRPNVGKSTLLNAILGQKVAIVSDRQQTTRSRILGIRTFGNGQIILVDTPGIHRPRHALGEVMVRVAREAVREVDIILFVTTPSPPGSLDEMIIESLKKVKRPVFLVMNKIDLARGVAPPALIDEYLRRYPFREVITLSARDVTGIDALIEKVRVSLPVGPKYYDDEFFTDQLEREMVSEIIREKIIGHTEEEIPHSVAVDIIRWQEEPNITRIAANIYVERDSQKGIIIGQAGRMLKAIGSDARSDIEKLLDQKVFLELWVKVKKGWRNDRRVLSELGYR